MAPREVLRSEGQDQEHPLVAEVVEEERDQVPRRRIGRLDILEHGDRRPLEADPAQHVQQLVEQPRLRLAPVQVRIAPDLRVVVDPIGSVARGERGHETGELVPSPAEHARHPILADRPDEVAQDRGHGSEREIPGRELEAVAHEHAHVAGPSRIPELGDEAGLADAGGAKDHGDRGVAVGRAGERVGQGRQLLRAPDELGTRHPGAHARSMQRRMVGATVSSTQQGPGNSRTRRGERGGPRRCARPTFHVVPRPRLKEGAMVIGAGGKQHRRMDRARPVGSLTRTGSTEEVSRSRSSPTDSRAARRIPRSLHPRSAAAPCIEAQGTNSASRLRDHQRVDGVDVRRQSPPDALREASLRHGGRQSG